MAITLGCRASLLKNRLSFALLSVFCLVIPHAAVGQNANLAQAEAVVRSHQWDEGLALTLQLLKSEPHNPRALNLAGLALTGKGEIQLANEYFKKAIAVAPGFVPALKNLAINEFNQEQYDPAEKHLRTALKASPDDPIAHLYLGEIAYRRKDYSHAADAFAQAQDLVLSNGTAAAHMVESYLKTDKKQDALVILDRLAPEQVDPQSQFALALALEQLGLPERAIPYLEAVSHRYPDTYEIGFDLVLGAIAVKDYTRAIQVGSDLIARGHETSELNNILAEAYADNNQIQQAVDALRRAIALDPTDEENYLDFASLCMNQRSLQAGMTVVEVGLKSHPKSDRLIFMRGVLYAMQDEFDLAEKDFKLSAELAPQTSFGYIGLGVSYLETGNDAKAIDVLRQRLREKPEDASLLYLLGEALIRSGAAPGSPAITEAQASLEKSVQLNPHLCLPHISLGSIYLDEDRPKDAAAQFELALAIDPKERAAYSHLAIAYRRMGDTDKARKALKGLQDVIADERHNTRERMKAAAEQEGKDAAPETHQ